MECGDSSPLFPGWSAKSKSGDESPHSKVTFEAPSRLLWSEGRADKQGPADPGSASGLARPARRPHRSNLPGRRLGLLLSPRSQDRGLPGDRGVDPSPRMLSRSVPRPRHRRGLFGSVLMQHRGQFIDERGIHVQGARQISSRPGSKPHGLRGRCPRGHTALPQGMKVRLIAFPAADGGCVKRPADLQFADCATVRAFSWKARQRLFQSSPQKAASFRLTSSGLASSSSAYLSAFFSRSPASRTSSSTALSMTLSPGPPSNLWRITPLWSMR